MASFPSFFKILILKRHFITNPLRTFFLPSSYEGDSPGPTTASPAIAIPQQPAQPRNYFEAESEIEAIASDILRNQPGLQKDYKTLMDLVSLRLKTAREAESQKPKHLGRKY
jgi:hypothetical protein